jgi:hypothetical protein
MRNGRLHAYEVLLRVAKVREVRASLALADASAEVHTCQVHCDEVSAAQTAVSAASRMHAADESSLDLARYEMLSNLDALLVEKRHVASNELAVAEQACLEHALAAVTAKRYREQIDGRVMETNETLDRTRFASQQEEAIECWLGSERR